MKFDVYGRFVLELAREADGWAAYRLGEGTRRRQPDLAIPPELEPAAVAGFLEDLFHELAQPGRTIRRIDG